MTKSYVIGAMIIKADKESNKIQSDLTKKLGGNVISPEDDPFEDFALGFLMESVKTDKSVSRDSIMMNL